jgi:hypothetical protein
MALLGGDKNSPKTTQQSSSTTKNTQIGGPTTAGANSTIGGAVTLSDLTGVNDLNISTTDQGAVNAGLQVALHALDTVQSDSLTSQQTAQGAIDSAVGVATTVAQGQQNTSLRYIIYGVIGLGCVAVAYAYFSHRR